MLAFSDPGTVLEASQTPPTSTILTQDFTVWSLALLPTLSIFFLPLTLEQRLDSSETFLLA